MDTQLQHVMNAMLKGKKELRECDCCGNAYDLNDLEAVLACPECRKDPKKEEANGNKQ